MPKLYVLVGPPGVRKSTWVRQNLVDPHVVSYDRAVDIVREPLGLRYDDVAGARGAQFRKEVEAVHREMQKGAVESGKDIVVDMTNMTVASRRRALSVIRGHEDEYEKIAVFFDFLGAEAGVHAAVKKRAEEEGDKTLSPEIVQGMMDRFVMPTEAEGFDKIVVVTPEHIRELKIRQLLSTIVRETLLREARQAPVAAYLRFGDPRKVAGGVSVIHDPYAYAYAEEPALAAFEPGETPPRLRSEAGISAYPVVLEEPGRIVFRIGNGMRTFSHQLGDFLMDRLMEDDIWIFKARRIPGAMGTDDEPLIDADTVRRPQQITADNLYVTALDTGDPSRDASRAEKLTDLLVPWDLMAYHDMGYNEFFKRKDVSREEIEAYIARLRVKFTRPEQVRKINELEESWLAEWNEDHSVNHH